MVTKEMIENSMEATLRKRNLRYLLIGFAILFFVYFGILLCSGPLPKIVWITVLISFFGICGGFVLYQWIRYRMLFFDREEYELYEVMLDRPTSSYLYQGYIYFTVMIETQSGMKIFRKTKAIWCDYFWSRYKAWEYMNSKIWIAYDEERDRMVVLGTEDDWRVKNERNYSNE